MGLHMNSTTLPLFEHSGVQVPEPAENSQDLKEPPDNKPLQVPSSHNGWVPSSESAIVAGREIGGMVYIGKLKTRTRYGGMNKCGAFIDPLLRVSETGTDKDGKDFLYRPSYIKMSPEQRAAYLDWLATGRSDVSYGHIYMQLYFFGLERRFALDDPPESERREILDEVKRLKDLYRDNRILESDLDRFIQFAIVSIGDISQFGPTYDRDERTMPRSLQVALGARIGRREPLSADWALSWFICRTDAQLRIPVLRCRDVFCALFKVRFDKRFPKGLKVKKPTAVLNYSYVSASNEFSKYFEVRLNGQLVPDVSRLSKLPSITQEIADEVEMDLTKLSRYLGTFPEASRSLEARELLPKDLWLLIPNKKLGRLRKWARKIAAKGDLVSVYELFEKIEHGRSRKGTDRKFKAASILLAQTGFGFSPDPNFALHSPKLGEPVKIFDTGSAVAQIDEVSETYRTALLTTAFGVFVAHADGLITESEREFLREMVNGTEHLSEQERRRLDADLEWMLSFVPGIATLRRKLKRVAPAAVPAIRNAMVSAAHADGAVQPQEVAAIEKVYQALGLNASLVYSDLHAGDMQDGLVKVRSAEPTSPGEAIPAQISTDGIQLDSERIATIHSDTDQVSSVLGKIFDGTEDDQNREGVQEMLVLGLDAKHAAFVREIVSKNHWIEVAFQDLCSRYSLMASGAMEVINEWAFDTFGDALLDEHDGYEVNADIADALKKVFAGEGGGVATETA